MAVVNRTVKQDNILSENPTEKKSKSAVRVPSANLNSVFVLLSGSGNELRTGRNVGALPTWFSHSKALTLPTLCTVSFEAIAVDTAGEVPLEQVLLRNLPACASMPAIGPQSQDELPNLPSARGASGLPSFSGETQPAKDFPLR